MHREPPGVHALARARAACSGGGAATLLLPCCCAHSLGATGDTCRCLLVWSRSAPGHPARCASRGPGVRSRWAEYAPGSHLCLSRFPRRHASAYVVQARAVAPALPPERVSGGRVQGGALSSTLQVIGKSELARGGRTSCARRARGWICRRPGRGDGEHLVGEGHGARTASVWILPGGPVTSTTPPRAMIPCLARRANECAAAAASFTWQLDCVERGVCPGRGRLLQRV